MQACASDIKPRTAPQRERYQDAGRATARAIRGISKFALRHSKSDATGQNHEGVAGFNHFSVEVYEGLRLPRKMSPRQTAAHTLCEPAQLKFTWTSQKRPFMREFTMKMQQTKTGTTPQLSSCASLRSRNAHGHLTRELLCENLQPKCRGPDGAP